jgi:hypothetical protein
MVGAAVVVARKPRLPLRATLGLIATGISLVILVFPGDMILPLFALMPVTPHMGGCANFLAPLVALAFFGLGILLSLGLIVVGIVAIVLTALRERGGPTMAVVVNAIVATLLLVMPFSLGGPGGIDQSGLGLAVLTAVAAAIPLAGALFLLGRSLYRSSRTYVATLVTAAVLLLPGAAGLTVLALDLGGIAVLQTQTTTPAGQAAHC